MYASGANQLYHLMHYAFAFWLLYSFFPRHMFADHSEDAAERFFARYMWAIFLYIIVGYVLVATKLFEVLAIIPLVLVFIYRRFLRRGAREDREEAAAGMAVIFYNTIEIGFRVRQFIDFYRYRLVGLWKPRAWVGSFRRSGVMASLVLVVVLCLSAYIRFYEAMTNPAPSMSDAYVVLAWMKYNELRMIFPTGIYPQGNHLLLAYLHKFSSIDAVYVLNYNGPMNAMMTIVGMYFAVSRFSGNCVAGIVSAALFGLFGYMLLGGEWERQIAANSQEFAGLFIFPVIYFYYKYLRDGKKEDLWVATVGCTITGLVHTLIFAYIGFGMCTFIGVSMLFNFKAHRRRIYFVVLFGIAAIVISSSPIVIARWFGIEYYGSSSDYLVSQVRAAVPELKVKDYLALAGMGMTLIVGLLSRKGRSGETPDLYIAALGIASFLLYYFGASLTNSEVLLTRRDNLWVFSLILSLGYAWAVIWRFLERVPLKGKLELALCATLIGMGLYHGALKPISSYNMEWPSGVEQYLKISSSYPPKTWLIVSQDEGYDLVFDKGYHMHLGDFLDLYNPTEPPLIRKGEALPDKSIAKEVFVYHEKRVFRGLKDEKMQIIYQQREIDNQRFEQWIALFKQVHGDADVYYEDDNLAIYHFQLPDPDRDKNTRIWGG
ncbi:hypothetical protein [Paenibacillus cremeus]|nr:hypothetical protein [Paenibacillus cremeus]